jgi:hypothetical protein
MTQPVGRNAPLVPTAALASSPGASRAVGRSAYNRPMDYQLVIKFWRKSLKDEDFLSTIQAELKDVLGDSAVLDGYDVNAKEINLFVITPEPKQTFRRVKSVLETRGILQGVSAASRLVGGAHFTSIWPLRVTRKFKLP